LCRKHVIKVVERAAGAVRITAALVAETNKIALMLDNILH
jgi:hypothetical protein